MLKYLKRQRSRYRSCEIDDAANNASADVDLAKGSSNTSGNISTNVNDKRNSLRSTSSFCDEVYLEELASGESEEDAVSCGASSLRSFVSAVGVGGGSASEDIFKYNSRLCMNLPSIVNDPICLSYFVQYLETKNVLPLIKFYLDIENFKLAAISQTKTDKDLKTTNHNDVNRELRSIPKDSSIDKYADVDVSIDDENEDYMEERISDSSGCDEVDKHNHYLNGNERIVVDQEFEEEYDKEINNVPELKTLCDLSMRKSITDDEKSQIYAETNKQITKCFTINNNDINTNNLNKNISNGIEVQTTISLDSSFLSLKSELNEDLKRSSQLSLVSGSDESTKTNVDSKECSISYNISAASVKDLIAIYQKYLNPKSLYYVNLPIGILSQISLLLCKNSDTGKSLDANETSNSVTVHCFDEAQDFVLKQLEMRHLNDFLQSSFYSKYCIELIENNNAQGTTSPLNICDVLFSEATLFFLMEYLEQNEERECLDFWTAAINFRKSFTSIGTGSDIDENEAQTDAMIIYDRFFSLQAENRLWSSKRLRTWVEERICATGQVVYCFDLPLKVIAKYLERKYLNNFIKSQLFENYVNELKTKIKDIHNHQYCGNNINIIDTKNMKLKSGCASNSGINGALSSPINNPVFHKLSLRRVRSNPTHPSRHRKTLSDCSAENLQHFQRNILGQKNLMNNIIDSGKSELSNSQTMPSITTNTIGNTTSTASSNLLNTSKSGNLHIDSRQLNNPNLLWQRTHSSEGGLKFGRVNSLGRYERDFDIVDSKNNWSLLSGSNKIKNAMRKLVNLPEEKVQEEIAWQVAEMIIKDVTSVTLPNHDNIPAQTL